MKKILLSLVLVVLLLLVPMNVNAAEQDQKAAEDALIATVLFSQNAINIVPNQPTIDQDILSVLQMPNGTNEELISNWVRLYVKNHYDVYAEKRSWLIVTFDSNNVQLYIFKGDQSFANMLNRINPKNYQKVSFGHFVENVGIVETEDQLYQIIPIEEWQLPKEIADCQLLDDFLQRALTQGDVSSFVYSYSSEYGQTWEFSTDKTYFNEYASEDCYCQMW